MPATRIDGKAVSTAVLDEVTQAARALEAETGVRPGLAVVLVGEDPASQVYVGSKGRTAEACGFHSVTHRLPAETLEADLLALIGQLNADPAIHGILQQLPLPGHLDPQRVVAAIDPDKDVDGLTVVNAGRLASGALADAFVPCTPAGCMVLLRRVMGDDLSGRTAVVLGRSNLVGKPMAHLLLAANATVTMAHSRTADLPAVCRAADILVAAVGRPEMVQADWIKPGAVVIDVGINRVDAPERGNGKTRLVGDVAYAAAAEVASAITPVPGGVGPMTIAMLMANTVKAACRATGRPAPRF
ncbi:bifunctional methylenetetrahydrofolate dehydrogenase/methenyltetrahydrofolate cyclohydrolase FolD [Mangrovibrevibacter kandeliae]|uniref:bifunctional methylenetetrahydrofolate dehydrogenase/methenyltetrahydrofolate cyclohydrolase FolD n=1 Tax=Mangrovibrevibacter kandeliae TaxID=2968473 RepID=UPI002117A2D2|nr:bifunctional methylenetetrahydrofolate dehydrogenase/methenyltetrahydrofolate cyclohydrolase FolD [Aurantimonas sp. CSK15Z-1]MCQ8784285.1 bifunctional methylenetetrahydrofolate dehydrogenase/methenyltetrahydrofolate cyclohydrolase FolD [Aurantimonas sp. CSK15Z-1]